MKEQVYILKKQNSFELKDIFECGQCFRWNKQEDESYTGVIKDAIINVKKENDLIIFDKKSDPTAVSVMLAPTFQASDEPYGTFSWSQGG